MAANRPTRRKLIGTPKGKFGYVCEEFNILTAGHDLRQWTCPFSDIRPWVYTGLPIAGMLGRLRKLDACRFAEMLMRTAAPGCPSSEARRSLTLTCVGSPSTPTSRFSDGSRSWFLGLLGSG